MNKYARFVGEYSRLAKVMESKDFLYMMKKTIAATPKILQSGKLTAVDNAMSLNLTLDYRSVKINVPCSDIDHTLIATDENAVFGNVREMVSNDVYFRAFSHLPHGGATIDLGANRGLFSVIAKILLKPEIVIGVEPLAKYLPAFKTLCDANAILIPE